MAANRKGEGINREDSLHRMHRHAGIVQKFVSITDHIVKKISMIFGRLPSINSQESESLNLVLCSIK